MSQVNSSSQQPVQQQPANAQSTRQPEKGDSPGKNTKSEGKQFSTALHKGEGRAVPALSGAGRHSPLQPGQDSPFAALGSRRKDHNEDSGRQENRFGGDALLGSMNAQSQTSAGKAEAVQPAAKTIDVELTDKIAKSIMVSEPGSAGNREVRISLREDVLPGTEIRLQRGLDGTLEVRFVTENPVTERMLSSAQLQNLQQTIVQNLQIDVRTSIVRPDGSMTAEAGTGQGGGDQQSGRGGQQGQQGGQGDQRRSSQHDLFSELGKRV